MWRLSALPIGDRKIITLLLSLNSGLQAGLDMLPSSNTQQNGFDILVHTAVVQESVPYLCLGVTVYVGAGRLT
jgi:hypothetical protein